jgi:hypothetical protein
LALEFEPLLEFLKHGLFEIYIGAVIGDDTAQKEVESPGSRTSLSHDSDEGLSKHSSVPDLAVDNLIRDATSSQFKNISRKRLIQLRKDYEEELKHTNSSYLAEKNLEIQNQRLISDLKRTEKMLSDLNKDHCDLAGQLVTVRIELAKEKEISSALRDQVQDLKNILEEKLSNFKKEDLQTFLNYKVSDNPENSEKGIPLSILQKRLDFLKEENLSLKGELRASKNQESPIESPTKATVGSWTADLKKRFF